VPGAAGKEEDGMTRLVKIAALLWFLLSVAGGAAASEVDDLSIREAMWRAAILALEEHGMTIQTASKEQGVIVTAFAALDPRAVYRAATLHDEDQGLQWARTEYRYFINIGVQPDHARPEKKKEKLLIKAEIWAWAQSTLLSPEEKRDLQSNQTLEKEFLQTFTRALGRVHEN